MWIVRGSTDRRGREAFVGTAGALVGRASVESTRLFGAPGGRDVSIRSHLNNRSKAANKLHTSLRNACSQRGAECNSIVLATAVSPLTDAPTAAPRYPLLQTRLPAMPSPRRFYKSPA